MVATKKVGARVYTVAGLALLVGLACVGVAAHQPAASVLLRTVPLGISWTGGVVDPSAIAVAAQADRVFVVDGNNGTVLMLDAGSGRVLHTETVTAAPSTIVVDERVGRVYVVDDRSPEVSVLDARSDRLLNTVTLSDPVLAHQNLGAPVVDARTDRVFIARYGGSDGKGYVDVLDARMGNLLRAVSVGKYTEAAALDERTGRLFVLNQEHRDRRCQCLPLGRGSVSVLDARDGRVLRTIAVGTGPTTVAVDAATNRVFVVNQPLPGNGSVSVLDAANGQVVCTVPLGRSPGQPVVGVRDAYALIPDSRGMNVLDARDGRLLRTIQIRADKYGNPATLEAVDEQRGRALAVNAAGAHLVDVRAGVIVRDYPAIDGVGALDQRSGRVVGATTGPRYFTNNPMGIGTVSVLDDQSGAVLHTVTAGLLPGLAALDERAGRAFVVNVGCPAPRQPCGPPPPPDPLGWMPSWSRRLVPWRPAASPTRGATVSVLDMTR